MNGKQPLPFALIARAMINHPLLDPGPDVGLFDSVTGVPADFSGELKQFNCEISVSLNYHRYNDNFERLEIEHEIAFDDVAIMISVHNNIELIGVSHGSQPLKLETTYLGHQLQQFVVHIAGKARTFVRDMAYETGLAPIFIELNDTAT